MIPFVVASVALWLVTVATLIVQIRLAPVAVESPRGFQIVDEPDWAKETNSEEWAESRS